MLQFQPQNECFPQLPVSCLADFAKCVQDGNAEQTAISVKTRIWDCHPHNWVFVAKLPG